MYLTELRLSSHLKQKYWIHAKKLLSVMVLSFFDSNSSIVPLFLTFMIKKTKKKKKVRIYFIKKMLCVKTVFFYLHAFMMTCLLDQVISNNQEEKTRVETSRIYTDDFTPSKTYQEFQRFVHDFTLSDIHLSTFWFLKFLQFNRRFWAILIIFVPFGMLTLICFRF